MERPFLGAKGFNTNLVHFLWLYHVFSNNLHLCSFMGMIFHMHRCASKMVLHAGNLVYEKLQFVKAW